MTPLTVRADGTTAPTVGLNGARASNTGSVPQSVDADAMGHLFSDDDRDKDVYTSEGTHVGTIHEVKDDRATVDRSRGTELTEKVKEMLGWGDDGQEAEGRSELHGDHVASVDDDSVRLRQH